MSAISDFLQWLDLKPHEIQAIALIALGMILAAFMWYATPDDDL